VEDKFMSISRAAVAAVLMASAAAVPQMASAETRFSFTSGVEYSSGDYGGTEDTEIVTVPLIGRLTMDKWEIRVSVPYRSITGPADIDEDGGAEGGAIARTDTESGLGDTTIDVTREFEDVLGDDTYFQATGRVRLPTGDEDKGLGNGATDYAAIGELGYNGDSNGLYVSAGRRFLGDSDSGSEREDGWQAGVGGWIRTSERSRVGLSYTWREATRDGRDDPSEAGAYLSYALSDQLRMSVSAAAGLSDASPDYRAGVRFTWRSEEFQRPGR
jgi:hypothetical protein